MPAQLPLRPTRSPIELMSSFQSYHPSLDALWRQFEQNFLPTHAPKSQPPRPIDMEMVLSPDEAISGGHFSIDVPVAHVCPRCEGTGSTGFFPCDLCEGRGVDWRAARVVVFITPGMSDGEIIPISLTHLGVKNLFLNVHVRVAV